MLRFVRTGVIVVVLLGVGGGVAGADPVPIDNVSPQTKHTIDGWDLTVSLTDMAINSVPNMAATAFTREGFVTGTATLTIGNGTSDGMREDVQSRALSLWAELGCQIDLTNGMEVYVSPEAGLATSVTSNATGPPTLGAVPNVSVEPQIEVTLLPGTVTDTVLGYKPLTLQQVQALTPDQSARARDGLVVAVKDFHIKVDKCGGPVSVRLHAQAFMSTADSNDDVHAYSDILSL